MNARSASQDNDDEDIEDTVTDDAGVTTNAVEVIIKEGKDGPVTVEDAPSVQAGDDDEDDEPGERHAATGRSDEDEDDEEDNAADSERVKRRKSERRAKRERARARAAQDAREISELRAQNGELLTRVVKVEQHTAMTELARIEGAATNAKADMEIRAANMAALLAAGKHTEYVKEQEAWADARAAATTLTDAATRMKQTLTRQAQSGGGSGGGNGSRGPVAIPPEVQQRVAAFSRKHSDWYDPKGGDTDSRIIRDIDQQLFNEGWDPSRQEYWEELESRAANYLPKRFTNGKNGDNVRQNNASGKRARSSTAGGGRDSGGGGSGGSGGGERFVLSAARVQAMKQAGLWENQKDRADTIKAYQKADRETAANQR